MTRKKSEEQIIFRLSWLEDMEYMSPEECQGFCQALLANHRGDLIPIFQDKYIQQLIDNAVEYVESMRVREIGSAKQNESMKKNNEQEDAILVVEPVKKHFVKPTQEEVTKYFMEHLGEPDDTEAILFYCYYESNGWKVGKTKMVCWHSAASGWHTRNKKRKYELNTKYERQQRADEQLVSSTAERCYRTIQAESTGDGENKFVPRKL